MGEPSHDLIHLDRTARGAAELAAQPKAAVFVLIGTALLLSWGLLGAMAVRAVAVLGPDLPGPGLGVLSLVPEIPLPALLERFFQLCIGPAASAGSAPFWALAAMWWLMAVAMMLPSAGPMIRTYCEIADTAAARGQQVVHPAVLVSGYLAVWLAAAIAFAGLAYGLQQAGAAANATSPVTAIAAAVALLSAGLYQFSTLKHACLTKCRNPFSTLFASWTTSPAGIFRLGMQQGLWCVGCCWALMLVMFAVGTMNIFWMVLIGIFTVVEKQTNNRLATHVAGAVLIGWAAALLAVSLWTGGLYG